MTTFSMKKNHCTLLTLLLCATLAACSAPAAVVTPTSSPANTEAPAPTVVTFADPLLEEMIRGALGLPDGGIPLAQAQAVTRLDLASRYQEFFPQESRITDLTGLENFTGLQSLDLSDQAVTDLSPLAGLTRLTTLLLAGNPVADVSPLAGLTSLKFLTLTGSQAEDYGALANLVNLQVLKLDDSTITDLSPLAALTNLRHLYLEKTVVNDYAPLKAIYPVLETRDFIIASSLVELGFSMNDENHEATCECEDASFTIQHSVWGPPPEEWLANSVRLTMDLRDGHLLKAVYYPDLDTYYFVMVKDYQMLLNYNYDIPTGNFTFEDCDRASSEQVVRAAIDVVEGEDPLLALVRVFNDTVKKAFARSTKALYAMSYEPPTLKNLGFIANQADAVYLYEYHGENILDYVAIEVHRPEWGEKEYDASYFTPLSEECRLNVFWYEADRKFRVEADDNNQGGASFEYFVDTGEFVDDDDPNMTVEEFFSKAYNDPSIEDVRQHSVDLMVNFVQDTFGMTIAELLALPTGE